MKRTSTILCSAALAILSATTLIAERPAPATPAEGGKEPQQAVESITPERRAEATLAINASVLTVLQGPRSLDDFADHFSRRVVPRQTLNNYTLNYTESAPSGVAMTQGRQPFEVRQPAASAKAKETVFLSGYYDGNSKSVQLYNTTANSYVVAAEHPFIKARLAKK